jgi:hypothetical protein
LLGGCIYGLLCLIGVIPTLVLLGCEWDEKMFIFAIRQHQHRDYTYKRLEFITNLMHNFIYSIIILHHDPQHVSSIAVLIFRRPIVYLQYLVSSNSICCHTVHRSRADCSPLVIGALDGSIQSGTIPDTVNIQLSS